MARTLKQIQAELDKYNAPERSILNERLNSLPGQAAAEISGLDAKLSQANTNILQGARSRGLGFSGIPIAEQAQYAATEYAPAVARVKQSQNDQRASILSALSGLTRDTRTQAQSIFENERNFAEQRRQFDMNYRLQQQQLAEQRRAAASAAAASSASAGDYLSALAGAGRQSSGGGQQRGQLTGGKTLNQASAALRNLLATRNAGIIQRTLRAIEASARRGNTYDQAKLQLINSQPQFKQYLANSNNARF